MIVVDPISVPHPGNLVAQDPGDFDFQKSSRQSHSEQPVPLGGVPRALREAAELSGLDPCSELYNEALRYAQEGHLRLSRERLQMLLCMAPDDGEARLMLARVHVAGQKWSEALAALDEAANCGVDVPMSLRRAVEDHLQAEQTAKEEQTGALKARENGEVKTLRQEARRLRTEHAQQSTRITDLEREVKKWAWATAGVSGLSMLFVLGTLVLGGGSSTSDVAVAPAEEPTTLAQADAEPAAEGGDAVPAEPSTLAHRAATALDGVTGLEGAALELKLAGDKAILLGEVISFKQKRAAERALKGVDGLSSVDTAGVVVLARTKGAEHVVEKNDTLSKIAQQYYGDGSLTRPIEEANSVTSKNLRIGQALKIPPVR
jgi:nucleoid-associated protein YgaU